MFDKEAGDQVDYQHCGCCLWSWHFSLGFGFFGCLVLPVVGRINSCTVLTSKGWKRGPKSSGCETEIISFYRAFCLPLLLWPVFSGVCVPPQNWKNNEFDFTSLRTNSICFDISILIVFRVPGNQWKPYQIKIVMALGLLLMLPTILPLYVFQDPKAATFPEATDATAPTESEASSEINNTCQDRWSA